MTTELASFNLSTYYGRRPYPGIDRGGIMLVQHGSLWYLYHKASGVSIGSSVYDNFAEASARADYLLGRAGIDWSCTFAEFIRSISPGWPVLTTKQSDYLAEYVLYIDTLVSPVVVVDHVWRDDPFGNTVTPNAPPGLRFGAYSWKAFLEKRFPEDSVLHMNAEAIVEWRKSRV